MAKEPIIKTPVIVEWSTDLKSIPKGKWVNETREAKGKKATIKVWHSDKLWVVMEGNFNGKFQRVVNATYWIPDENRWCMLNEGQDGILAWARYEPLDKFQSMPEMPDLRDAA